jgi:hypothetical protein
LSLCIATTTTKPFSLCIAQSRICNRQCMIYTILLTFILVFICMIPYHHLV